MNMGKKKKIVPAAAATAGPNSTGEENLQNFDEFLETLDDSDSENESDAENDSDDLEESVEQDRDGSDEEEDISDDDGDEIEPETEDELEIEEEPKISVGHDNGQEDSDLSGDDDPEQSAAEHKKSLDRLKETDPDFFEFLKQNDADLLNFDDDDSDSEDDDTEGAVHELPEHLEEASDSEAEEERIDTKAVGYKNTVEMFVKQGIVNLEVIKDWDLKLSSTRDLATFSNVVDAFECAIYQILQDENADKLKWKVDSAAYFNALVRMCTKQIPGFAIRFLYGSNNLAVSQQKFENRPLEVKEKCSQKWNKLRSKLRIYMGSLVQYLKSMGNTDAVASILRHCQKMAGFWALLGPKSYKLLRTFINIWSQGEDSCRVLAYLNIFKMTNYNHEVFLNRVYKQMYLAYVANCKFTFVNTWPSINFMRTSLLEIYILDTSSTYSIAFPFIRQLAIHLKNALTAGKTENQMKQNKKEASRIVYSWQFLHSLHLWVDLLSNPKAAKDQNLKLLFYPVVQICLGTIKLIPTKKYIPLRFLITRMLIKLQEKTDTFIPILPLITQVLLMTDFSMKSVSKFSARPLDMTCCVKADATESGYGKAISENTFELILRACKAIATDLAFVEIVTPAVMQLRFFLKKQCKNPEVSRKFKTLIEKIEANSKYISTVRNKGLEMGSISLSDMESQKILRVQMETSLPHPPIIEFANDYLKVHEKTQAKFRKVDFETRDEKLIPKPSALNSNKQKKKSKSNDQLLDSDEESDDGNFKTKLDAADEIDDVEEETPKKKTKKLKRKLNENSAAVNKKKKKKSVFTSGPEAPDELVDLELSD